jgi:hypothetical protein
MERLRELLKGPAGMTVAAVLLVAGLYFAIQAVRGVTSTEGARLSAERVFVDAKTGKSYEITLKPGMPMPAPAPSGGNTGYPAEACYWTKDGKAKEDPTYVLMNDYLGKKEPTFCPDCGRLVKGHNPRPGEGVPVPPTQEEYKKRGPERKR